jgi:hypothetical protein
MSTEGDLWEHKETGDIVNELMTRLVDGQSTSHYEEKLIRPLRSAISAGFEEHPVMGDDPHLDERIDHIIREDPELFQRFKQFVQDAFDAGPDGNGSRQHFSLTINPMMAQPS